MDENILLLIAYFMRMYRPLPHHSTPLLGCVFLRELIKAYHN
jgi:hypothetical protein